MEPLRSCLRRHFTEIPAVASRNVGGFLRLREGKLMTSTNRASPQKAQKVYFRYLQLYSNSELKNGDSIMLSICKVQASNKDPAVTAAETGNQRSFGNDNTPV